MEKRLPLVLFVSFVLLMGMQIFFGEDAASKEDREKIAAQEQAARDAAAVLDGETADGAGGDTTIAAAAGESAAALPEVEPWDTWQTFGAPGENGYMAVHFDSLGGSISEIRLGNYHVAAGLDDAAKAERENWVSLARPVKEKIGEGDAGYMRTLQTLMLRAPKNDPGTAQFLSQDPATVHWKAESLEGGVRFTHQDPSGLRFTKTIRSVPGENHLDVTIGLETTDEALAKKSARFWFVSSVGMRPESNDSGYPEPRAVAARDGKDPKEESLDTKGREHFVQVLPAEDIAYFGAHNKYFALLARPATDTTRGAVSEVRKMALWDGAWVAEDVNDEDRWKNGFRDMLVEADLRLQVPAVGASSERSFVLYAGPKDKDHFSDGDVAFKDILQEDLGFFDGIAGVILGYLRFLHGIVGNWGWAIIILTLTVRLLLFPLQRKMQTSMARHATKMKRVQPKIDAVKEKYKDDPKKLREEQARLFQSEGAMPPIGGCLPIFLQIPIFFGLFSALRVAFDLRHEPFMGWITDLSQPDRLARIDLNTHLPFIGTIEWFNILPILMVVLWIAQQKVMPKPATMNEQQAQMQKIMMWMPIMFGFFLYNYAAGLSLYMITTSIFGILEATFIRKVWPIDDKEQPKKKGRFMEKLGQLQEQAMQMQEQQRRAQAAGGGAKGQQRRSGGKKKR